MDDVIVLSPFRDVARRLAGLRSRYDGITAGTVHTAQGRERRSSSWCWEATRPVKARSGGRRRSRTL